MASATDDAFVTPGEVRRIVAIAEPTLRNLQITHSYYALASALKTRILGGSNWGVFATWASKQAGQTIRYEDLCDALWRRCAGSRDFTEALRRVIAALGIDETVLQALLRDALAEIGPLSRTSQAIAAGNLKVYEEIGFYFARFIEEFPPEFPPDEDKLERFCEELRPGPPPDGQTLLRNAFRNYYAARFVEIPDAQAELLLLANLQIGLHEQTRLQPELEAAMNALFVDEERLADRIEQRLKIYVGWLSRILRRLFPFWKTPVRSLSRALAGPLAAAVRGLLTERIMHQRLADGQVLRLGQDVLAPVPDELRQIANTELLAFLEEIDPNPAGPVGSGAEDWSRLADRMHYVAEYFRAYQGHHALEGAPFTPEQVEILQQGRIPPGPL